MVKPMFKTCLAVGLLLTLGGRTATAEWNIPHNYSDIAIFPHLAGVADIIFTGTPISTNGYVSAEFAVEQ